jgi:hypothetical protein
MTYQGTLADKVDEIRRLAWKKLDKEYHLAGADYIPDGDKYDWGISIEDVCGRLQSFADIGDPDAFTVMQKGLANPPHLQAGAEIIDKRGRVSPLDADYLTVADNILAVPGGDLQSVQTLVAEWAGAPKTFVNHVFDRYTGEPGILRHQLAFLAELGALAEACKKLLQQTQKDVLQLADSAIEKLHNLYSGGMDGSGGAVDFTFEVAGVVASVAGAGPWIGAAISLGSYLHGLHEAGGAHHDHEHGKIKGGTVGDVLASIVDQSERLQRLAEDEVPHIARALAKDLQAVEGGKLDNFMFAGHGMDNDTEPVNRKIRLIYEDGYIAGRVHLSAAAYHYQAASWRLDACTGRADDAFGWLLDGGPKRDFLQLRDDLNLALTKTRDYFSDAGEAMCAAVATYAEQDGFNADQLRADADKFAADDPYLTTLNELHQRTQPVSDFPPHHGPR